MTDAKYMKARKQAGANYDLVSTLELEYVEANAQYRIGDIVFDGRDVYRIKKYASIRKYAYDVPTVAYHAVKLKENLEPRHGGWTYIIREDSIVNLVKQEEI